MTKRILLTSSILLISLSASAENWYVDGGIGFMNFDDGIDTISPTNLYVRGGYKFNPYFNIGLESNATLSPDQVSYIPEVDFDVTTFTAYVRGGVPVSNNVWVYGQIGQANTELTGSFQNISISESDNDMMYGLGAEIDLGSKTTYLSINYSAYNNNDGVDVNALNIGIGARF